MTGRRPAADAAGEARLAELAAEWHPEAGLPNVEVRGVDDWLCRAGMRPGAPVTKLPAGHIP
jgi:hypothetical protein